MLSLNPILFKKVWNLEYPINRVVEFQDNLDHSTYLGFTWVLTHLDRFPKGRTTTTNAGTQGGEKTHILTAPEMPSHSHGIYGALTGETKAVTNTGNDWGVGISNYWTINTSSTGGDQPHNNEPQFEITAYWKRTA